MRLLVGTRSLVGWLVGWLSVFTAALLCSAPRSGEEEEVHFYEDLKIPNRKELQSLRYILQYWCDYSDCIAHLFIWSL